MLKEWILNNPFSSFIILLGVFVLVRHFKTIFNIFAFIISLLFSFIKIPFLLILLFFYNAIHKKVVDNAINNFESSIIKKDIDIAACHTYFNRVGAGGIKYLMELYQEKISNEIDNNECDNEQIERYNYLMEIMSRSLYYNTLNKR